MDNRSGNVGPLGVRAGEQLHHGRVHPPPADNCSYRGGGRVPARAQSQVGCSKLSFSLCGPSHLTVLLNVTAALDSFPFYSIHHPPSYPE